MEEEVCTFLHFDVIRFTVNNENADCFQILPHASGEELEAAVLPMHKIQALLEVWLTGRVCIY